jgi:hypothetical protein
VYETAGGTWPVAARAMNSPARTNTTSPATATHIGRAAGGRADRPAAAGSAVEWPHLKQTIALDEISVPQCLQFTSGDPACQLYTARMIPVRDVIPSRTYPGATVALLAAQAASLVAADARRWWFPWCVNVIVLWIFGSTVEDRMGHGRFVVFYLLCGAASAAVAAAAGAAILATVAAGGAVAGVAAAYFLMFPRSRVLTLVPVVGGVDVVDVPAWCVCGVWAMVHGAAAGAVVALEAGTGGLAMIAGLLAGAVTGGLGWLVFRRPERMRVDWWD